MQGHTHARLGLGKGINMQGHAGLGKLMLGWTYIGAHLHKRDLQRQNKTSGSSKIAVKVDTHTPSKGRLIVTCMA